MVQAPAVATHFPASHFPASTRSQFLASRSETLTLASCRCHVLIVRGHPLATVPVANDVVVWMRRTSMRKRVSIVAKGHRKRSKSLTEHQGQQGRYGRFEASREAYIALRDTFAYSPPKTSFTTTTAFIQRIPEATRILCKFFLNRKVNCKHV